MKRRFLVGGISLITACANGVSFGPGGKTPPQPQPLMTVEPAVLDFGGATTEERVELEVRILSTGFNDLDIDEIVFGDLEGDEDGPAAGFEIVLPEPLPWVLPRGESKTFKVAYTPAFGGEAEGVITVHSDAQVDPERDVLLSAWGEVAQLEIKPDPIDFGNPFVPCGGTRDVSFTNVGPEPLDVTSIRLEDSEGQYAWAADPPSLPRTLRQFESFKVPLDYFASVAGGHEARVVATSTDPGGRSRPPSAGTPSTAPSSPTSSRCRPSPPSTSSWPSTSPAR